MAIVKETKRDSWVHIGRKIHDADMDALYFGRLGEFSPRSDIAFNKHIRELNDFKKTPFFQNLNGTRAKEIKRKMWYK